MRSRCAVAKKKFLVPCEKVAENLLFFGPGDYNFEILLGDNDNKHVDLSLFKHICFNTSVVFDKIDNVCNVFTVAQRLPLCEFYDIHDLYDFVSDDSTIFNLPSFNSRSDISNLKTFLHDFQYFYLNVVGMCQTRLTDNTASLYKIQSYDMFT